MYTQGQWLWDRELNQPVQYLGVEIFLIGPSRWHVRENGIEKYYEFNGYKWWHERYTNLRDGDDPTKILTGRTGPSQFYGGPYKDCVEVVLERGNMSVTICVECRARNWSDSDKCGVCDAPLNGPLVPARASELAARARRQQQDK